LAEAHLPSTPVIPIPNELAAEVKPLVTKINAGELVIDVSSTNVYKGNFNSLQTIIKFDSLSSNEVDLYAPTLPSIPPFIKSSEIGPDTILKFVNEIRSNLEKKNFNKAGFYSETVVPVPQSSSEPAFFVVNYPITVRTKTEAICIVVSGFSAYPINTDETYCQQ
jgi:hypothetical protein